jgi:hypothetical protein
VILNVFAALVVPSKTDPKLRLFGETVKFGTVWARATTGSAAMVASARITTGRLKSPYR